MLTTEEEPFRNFSRRLYRALQEDGSSLWEARHPADRLRLEKRFKGRLAFNREKMNEPPPAHEFFREEWIHYYHPDILKDRDLEVAGFFEPALKAGAGDQCRTVVTVGWDRRESVFYVMDAFIRRVPLEAAVAAVCRRHRRYSYGLLGVADHPFQRLLLKEFERLGQEEGLPLPLKVVSREEARESWISSLAPLLQRGRLRFIRGHSDQELLVEQLLYFPSQALGDEGPAALAGAIRLARELAASGRPDDSEPSQG
jgi:hypothetical protein